MQRFAGLFVLWLGLGIAMAQPPVFRLGIVPVQDGTGDVFGDVYRQNLRRFLVEDLIRKGHQALFINTGPNAGDDDYAFFFDLARELKTDAVLIVRLLTVVDKSVWPEVQNRLEGLDLEVRRRDAEALLTGQTNRPDKIVNLMRKNRGVLVTEALLLPLVNDASGKALVVSTPVGKKVLLELQRSEGLVRSASPAKRFEKNAAGRAASKAADMLVADLQEVLESSNLERSGRAVAAGGLCDLTFSVRYATLERSSRNYTVAINGLEMSYAIRNGRVQTSVPGGLLQFRIVVLDPPYGLSVQKNYDANTFLECQDDELSLVFEIEAAGEGSLHVEQP